MKRIFKATCLSLLILPVTTFSQFPFKGDVIFVPCSPCYSFTGYYLGANVGWKFASYTTDFETDSFVTDDVVTPPQEFEFDTNKNSFTGGGQIGYNLQRNHFLFGFEADWNTQSIGDTNVIEVTNNPAFVEGDTFKTKTRWENSYRLRLGYVYRNWLFYGTAGVSRINYQVTANVLSPDDSNASTSKDTVQETALGETIGIGTELALSKYWSIGTEYRFSTYPGQNFHMNNIEVQASPAVSTPINAHVRGLTTNQLLFKVNFRVYA